MVMWDGRGTRGNRVARRGSWPPRMCAGNAWASADQTYHYTSIKYASYDGSSCAGGLGQRDATRVQRGIAVVV